MQQASKISEDRKHKNYVQKIEWLKRTNDNMQQKPALRE